MKKNLPAPAPETSTSLSITKSPANLPLLITAKPSPVSVIAQHNISATAPTLLHKATVLQDRPAGLLAISVHHLCLHAAAVSDFNLERPSVERTEKTNKDQLLHSYNNCLSPTRKYEEVMSADAVRQILAMSD